MLALVRFILVGVCFSLVPINSIYAAKDLEENWKSVIREQHFQGRNIDENDPVITIDAPERAEDPSMVPIRITSKIPQTANNYIKTITLFIDNNPVPFSARFHFTPASGKADLALRTRINYYTYVRAIAEMNDGSLSMHKVYVKASGGCSAPLGSDLDAAMARLGKMRWRLLDGDEPSETQGEPTLAQLMISHPNVTGLQMDQVTRLYRPAHFVKSMKITFNGETILTAETDIAISADPNFRFYFIPTEEGELKAEVTDNKGLSFSNAYHVKP